ncbi:carboxypeptidase-like regulatory domain-containing protein [Urbifossiella limnaea]|uniref:Cornifin (SPRR) family protein n=1 Tax=Urbifossiella limnaea TaxID=2528023 RepID=A0A517XYU0_9BACT|nr:carboxypeptidase-like regulatory domain-containing protein [Urbifossiella limnaea]QDU22672.1 Cornifin (SPRR) family protein [Urbifossiella limnaea]
MSRLFLAAALAALVAGAAGAADPVFDKALRDSLAGVHNSGADLYNQGKDYAGAFRLYEGALRTSRPLLAHRPATQAAIDDGLAAAARESDAAKKAFLLHEAIEKVRSDLKEPVKGAVVPEPKKTVTPEPKKTVTPEPKKTTEPEPKKTTTPEPKKTTVPEVKKGAAGGPEVKGKVTYKGQPVADATLTFTTLDRMVGVPAVTAKTGADATYRATLVAGRYAVTVTATANGKAVLPARYAAADTSGLTFVAPAGASTFDVDLQ